MKKNYFKLGVLFFGVILLLFFIYLFLHFAEIKKIYELILKVRWYILLILIIFEVRFILNRGDIFKVLYNRLGVPMKRLESVRLFLASYAVNIVAPVAGFSGTVIYMTQTERQGISKAKVVLITLLFYFIDFISLAILLLIAFIYLFQINALKTYFLLSFGFLIILILALLLLVFFSLRYKKIFIKVVRTVIRFANFFLHLFKMKLIDHNHAHHLYREVAILRKTIRRDKLIFWEPFLLFLLGNFYEIISLYVIFWAFGTAVSPFAVIAGYAIGLLFMVVSFTPAGVGIVEPLMAVTFTSFGISLEASVLAILIFRAITFWLPLPFGVALTKKYLIQKNEQTT